MPFSLKHIPKWHALEIKTNGKNTSKVFGKYMTFMDGIREKVAPDDYTFLIPEKYLDPFLKEFGYITTMTQTVASIKNEEKTLMPDISYELKHIDSMKLTPYPFQQIGIAYLVSVKKGILGDEMGLGKTTALSYTSFS